MRLVCFSGDRGPEAGSLYVHRHAYPAVAAYRGWQF